MSEPPGSAASTSIEAGGEQHDSLAAARLPSRSRYMQQLSLRREAAEVQRLVAYGLTLGWIFFLVGSFLLCCVPNRFDWLWTTIALIGVGHLVLAVIIPQALAWPERIWMTIARWQGHLVMTVLLTIVYFALIWPASRVSRRYQRCFFQWHDQPPDTKSAWEAMDLAALDSPSVSRSGYRSLPVLLAGIIGFFFRRGNYILLPIIVLLILLGLVLFIVQNSVLAPFIYPLF